LSKPSKKLIPFGKILKPHGIKGEMKISIFDNESDFFLKDVFIWFKSDNSYKSYELEYVKGFSKNLILKLNQVNDRSEVEAFLNKQIFISRDDFLKINNSNYYITDFIGLEIFDENDNSFGLVSDAIKLPGNDILVSMYNSKEIMIPIVDYFIEFFDFKKKIIKVKNIKSLLEI